MPARPFVDEETALRLLRIVPLACGAAQVELSYRAVRLAFPSQPDLQRLGTLLGGLLPMSVYMSQYVGNEPLAGVLTAAAIVVLLRWTLADATPGAGSQWLAGILLGLAMLTKPTAVLVVAPALLVLAHAHARAGRPPPHFLRAGARVLIALALVAGWYYVRNWITLGAPFVGGWDRSRGFGWWQEPGYRVPAHLLSFGEALRFPVFGGVAGLWDAEYASFWLDGWLSGVAAYESRPPWNYALMLPAPWVALLPAAALVVGAAGAPWQPAARRRALVLAVGLVAIYLAATLTLYLQVPIYAAAKATQLLGLTPCFAVLGAAGYGGLGRAPAARPLLYGATACWALCAFLAYVVW
jgi:4-amino-4-deoxy-L-arabinose transferase-like glycosyltransferase